MRAHGDERTIAPVFVAENTTSFRVRWVPGRSLSARPLRAQDAVRLPGTTAGSTVDVGVWGVRPL